MSIGGASSDRDRGRGTAATIATVTPYAVGVTKWGLNAGLVKHRWPDIKADGNQRLGTARLVQGMPDKRLLTANGKQVQGGSRALYGCVTALITSIAVTQALGSVPLIKSAVDDDRGWEGLYQTRQGRTGIAFALGGGSTVALFGLAAVDSVKKHHSQGIKTVLKETISHPKMAPKWLAPLGTTMFVGGIANEMGAFDAFNRVDVRDQEKREDLILGAGASGAVVVGGISAARAAAATRGSGGSLTSKVGQTARATANTVVSRPMLGVGAGTLTLAALNALGAFGSLDESNA